MGENNTPTALEGCGVKTHGQYSKVKSRSHHIVSYLQPPTNAPTQYQLATRTYGFQESPDKILKLKVTAAKSNQGFTMMLHSYNSQQMSLSSINFLHVTVSEI